MEIRYKLEEFMRFLRSVRYELGRVIMIDQIFFLREFREIELRIVDEVVEVIIIMKVCGVFVIGVVVVFGLVFYVDIFNVRIKEEFMDGFERVYERFKNICLIVVNFFWVFNRVKSLVEEYFEDFFDEIKRFIVVEVQKIVNEDVEVNLRMGYYGVEVFLEGNVLIYCNVGSLVMVQFGMVGVVLRVMYRDGIFKFLWVDEMRFVFQGVRFLVWEYYYDGIFFKFISDNMVGFVMQQGKVDVIIVGVDRIVVNGDFVNKIGIYIFVVFVKEYGIFFFIVVLFLMIDMSLKSGKEIFIEECKLEEVFICGGCKIVLDVDVYNLVFDVMFYKYLIGIIMDQGVVWLFFERNFKKFFKRE